MNHPLTPSLSPSEGERDGVRGWFNGEPRSSELSHRSNVALGHFFFFSLSSSIFFFASV